MGFDTIDKEHRPVQPIKLECVECPNTTGVKIYQWEDSDIALCLECYSHRIREFLKSCSDGVARDSGKKQSTIAVIELSPMRTLPPLMDKTPGVTVTIVGSGVENGSPYVDYHFSGIGVSQPLPLDKDHASDELVANSETLEV
jgi:hypothetical protein